MFQQKLENGSGQASIVGGGRKKKLATPAGWLRMISFSAALAFLFHGGELRVSGGPTNISAQTKSKAAVSNQNQRTRIDPGRVYRLPQKPRGESTIPNVPPRKSATDAPIIPNEAYPRPGLSLSLVHYPEVGRVGETVSFRLQIPSSVSHYPPMEASFDDGSARERLESNRAPVFTHIFSAPGTHTVSVYQIFDGYRITNAASVTLAVEGWRLIPPKALVEVGQPISFAVERPSEDKAIVYRFSFGDGTSTTWNAESRVTHRYHINGDYNPFVEVGRSTSNPTAALATAAASVRVRGLTSDSVTLTVEPGEFIQAGRDATLKAALRSKYYDRDPNLRYKFVIANDVNVSSQSTPELTHFFASAGEFPTRVDVTYVDQESGIERLIASSGAHTIHVTPVPADPNANRNSQAPSGGSSLGGSPGGSSSGGGSSGATGSGGGNGRDPSKLVAITAAILVAMAALFGAYRTLKGRFSFRAEYVVQPDRGAASVSQRELALDYEVHLKPDISRAQSQIETSPAGLILYVRSQK